MDKSKQSKTEIMRHPVKVTQKLVILVSKSASTEEHPV